jgi:DNA (cytosine-5)-methyltransferase 1
MAAGDDSTAWTEWEDDKSPLVCQPVRWVRDLMPEWVALEEVPAVASLWEHFARIFRGWGYSVWTGDLCAADYGVPQTRTRRILMASRTMTVQPPAPTHSEYPQDGGDLFGGQMEGWVSMATALGWDHGLDVNTRGDRKTSGGNEFSADRPSWALTGKPRSWFVVSEWLLKSRRDSDAWVKSDGARPNRTATQPAPTFTGEAFRWTWERPATTVVGSFCPDVIAAPGYRVKTSRQNAPGSVKVTVAEAGVLQSFPAEYPWQGSRSKKFEQAGNAIPPRLAMHILAALGVGAVTSRQAAA